MYSATRYPHLVETYNAYRTVTHTVTGKFRFDALWDRLPGGAVSTPFQTPEFLEAFFHAMVPEQCRALKICEIRDAKDGSARALFPYALFRRGPVEVASLPDFGLADQIAPVTSRRRPVADADLHGIAHLFIEALDPVDLIDIHKIPPSLGGQPNPLFHFDATEPQGEMYTLDLTGSDSARWRHKSVLKKARANVRRLANAGVEFFTTRDPEASVRVFETLREQRRKRFAEKRLPNTLEDRPGYATFYHRLSAGASQGGPIVALGFRSGDEIAAASLAFVGKESVNGVLISIGDDKWARYSPGIALIAKTIEWAEAAGMRDFHFGTGMQDYKQRFGGDTIELHRIFRPVTAKGQAYALTRKLYRTARRAGVPLPDAV